MSEVLGVEHDGFQATEDLSHLSEEELMHRFINATITLAHRRDVTLEELLRAQLESLQFTVMLATLFGTNEEENDSITI